MADNDQTSGDRRDDAIADPTDPADAQIPHEHRAKLSNMVVGKAKEALGALTHDRELEREGKAQEDIAEHDTKPDL